MNLLSLESLIIIIFIFLSSLLIYFFLPKKKPQKIKEKKNISKKFLNEMEENIDEIKDKLVEYLSKKVKFNKQEIEKIILRVLESEIDLKIEKYKIEKMIEANKTIKEKAVGAICLSLENFSSELVFPKTTSVLKIDEDKGKIIGKDGRNITAFRKITGTEVMFDKNYIQISSFNSLRREIAYRTMEILIKEKRFSPLQIEKTYLEIKKNIKLISIEKAEEVIRDLGIQKKEIHPELLEYLGKLYFHSSFGQNALAHSLEAAKISGRIAVELGLNENLAIKAGLFHDIGKAEKKEKRSHVASGVILAEKYKLPPEVINAIASHHRDVPADNYYSLIVLAADRLSAARPGARNNQLEIYTKRMKNLENIAQEFYGIKKSYAFQAGREIWIIVDAEKLDDFQTWELSEKIKKKIQEEIIPGEVTINVLREKKFTHELK